MAVATVICINPACSQSHYSGNPTVHRNAYIDVDMIRNGLCFCRNCSSSGLVVINLTPGYAGRVIDDAGHVSFIPGMNPAVDNAQLPPAIPYPFTPAHPHPVFVPRPVRAPAAAVPHPLPPAAAAGIPAPPVMPPPPPRARGVLRGVTPLLDRARLDRDEVCTICQEGFAGTTEEIVQTNSPPCTQPHRFHSECLAGWQSARPADTYSYSDPIERGAALAFPVRINTNTCPVCRAVLF